MFFEMGLDMGQNFNRYSYCLNNPLLYSDPSGNSWISDAFHWVKKTIWDTPWRWLNGSDKGHPGVYSGGFSQKLDKWGAPSFGAGYNSSQGGFYYMSNNPRVYPAMEATLQKQYAAVITQTQQMVQAEANGRNWGQSIDLVMKYAIDPASNILTTSAGLKYTSRPLSGLAYFRTASGAYYTASDLLPQTNGKYIQGVQGIRNGASIAAESVKWIGRTGNYLGMLGTLYNAEKFRENPNWENGIETAVGVGSYFFWEVGAAYYGGKTLYKTQQNALRIQIENGHENEPALYNITW